MVQLLPIVDPQELEGNETVTEELIVKLMRALSQCIQRQKTESDLKIQQLMSAKSNSIAALQSLAGFADAQSSITKAIE